MSRAQLDYTARQPSGRTFAGVDVTTPAAGFYRTRLRGGGAFVGIRIMYGPPLDPLTGEVLDRSWRWQALANDEPVNLDAVWPQCTGDPITEGQYQDYCRRQAWARSAAPDSAYADPLKRFDPLSRSNPMLF